jgi:cyanophycinase
MPHRYAMHLVWIVTAVLASSLSAKAAPAAPDSPKGHLLIVGGGPIPDEIEARFLALAGGPEKARIVVFPMASSDPDAGIEMTADFRKAGATAERLVFDHAQADTEEAARRLEDVTGVWFGGGDQAKLTAALGGTKVEAAIRERFVQGAVIGGTSAGAAVMSTPMITGDERKIGGPRPPSDPKDSLSAFMTIARDDIITEDGFGLISGAIVDQHFIRRRRANRLISTVLEHPTLVGVGVDESTALDVAPDGSWTVLGESAAVVFDARRATITPPGAPTLGATGVRMSVLPAGSRYVLSTGEVTLPPQPKR